MLVKKTPPVVRTRTRARVAMSMPHPNLADATPAHGAAHANLVATVLHLRGAK